MSIDIRMTGPEADQELTSLYTWLREEPDVRRHAHISLRPAKPDLGELGGAFEIIQLVVDSGFQALNFALAFAAWRSTRKSRPRITIEYDSGKIALDDIDSNAIDVIVRTLGEE